MAQKPVVIIGAVALGPMDMVEFEKYFLEDSADEPICLEVRSSVNGAPYVAHFGERETMVLRSKE